jgi:hypothetical protein
MKQTLLTLAAVLLIGGAALAQDKGKADKHSAKKDSKACCTKEQPAQKKACCMQPANTATLRAAAVKRVKPAPAARPAGKK